MESIRTALIINSTPIRNTLMDLLQHDEKSDVIFTATNGVEGFNKINKLSPDVIILDLDMPAMDGVEILKYILNYYTIPIIIMADDTKSGHDKITRGLANGAIDFFVKPTTENRLEMDQWKYAVLDKIHRTVHRDKTVTNGIEMKHDYKPTFKTHHDVNSLVAIGTSTGGPRALQQVFFHLPNDFSTPIMIVQHMPAGFTKSLADRLDKMTNIHVKEAIQGEEITKHTAYIAPGGQHMKVVQENEKLFIELTKENPRNGHRPSVDVLFESMATIKAIYKVVVVLTGMGKDGAKGIETIKHLDPNCTVISEAKESSIVYGMPKAAKETGLVDHIVHLNRVGDTIVRLI